MGYEYRITDADGSTVTIATTPEQAQEFMAAVEAQREGVPDELIREQFPGASFAYTPGRPDRVEIAEDGACHEFYRGVRR